MEQPTKIKANFIDSLWTFFASVRLTVVVLLVLAALSIIGTLIPQNQNPSDYFRAFSPFVYQLLSTLDIFDMYHSWWFQGTILMLALNIIVCSIDRMQKTWSVLFPKTRTFNLDSFRKRKNRIEMYIDKPMDELRDVCRKQVRAFRYCRNEAVDGGFAITAEKGRWTRLGVYGVHLSIVVLLIGGLIGSKFGFEGYVNIPEGETVDTIDLRFTNQTHRLNFAIRCDDFDVRFYEEGNRPKEFRSTLVIVENNRDVVKKDIIVNDPLRYKGVSIYQSSYGKLNPMRDQTVVPETLPEQISLTVQSTTSGMIYSLKAKLKQPVTLPEKQGTLVLDGFQREAEFKTMALGPSFTATLTPKEGLSQKILLPVRFPKFDTMRGGAVIVSVDMAELAAKSKPADTTRYYTGLQVVYDPGIWVVYIGFIMMITGCVVAFFMSHQQVVIEVTQARKGMRVMIAGKANKNKVGLQQKLSRLAERLKGEANGIT